MDPNINSLLSSNEEPKNDLHRIEEKINRILQTVNLEENDRMPDIRDVMQKLDDIHHYITCPSDNPSETKYPSETGMTQKILMEDLGVSVDHLNDKIRTISLNSEEVI